MADLNPGADVPYRPITSWAVAGLLVGGAYFAMALLGIVSLYAWSVPLFLSDAYFFIPLAGVVLSGLGLYTISQSEGTRAGRALALAGLWLSLLGGIMYFVFLHSIRLAQENQVQDFLTREGPGTGFFPRILKSAGRTADLNSAFMLTLPAANRADIEPNNEREMALTYDMPGEDGTPGGLTQFRDHPIVAALARAGAEQASVESMGMQSWSYKTGSFQVTYAYRVRCPEFTMELALPVESTEPEKSGQARKWFVNFPRSRTLSRDMTPLGVGIQNLWLNARMYIDQALVPSIRARETAMPFMDLDRTNWTEVIPAEEDTKKVPAEVVRKVLQQFMHEQFAGPAREFLRVSFPKEAQLTSWEQKDGRIRMSVPFKTQVPAFGKIPAYNLQGVFALRTPPGIDPADFVKDMPILRWEMEKVQVLRAKAYEPK